MMKTGTATEEAGRWLSKQKEGCMPKPEEQCRTAQAGEKRQEAQADQCCRIGAIAMEAMLSEVSATPKPGLVDRDNCGAHHDMDFFTFMSSAAALHGAFDELALAGAAQADRPITELLPVIRPIGMKAERNMFAFTKGVNTHKGMIFSLGLLCACAGWALGRGWQLLPAKELANLARQACAGLCAAEYGKLGEKEKQGHKLTKGEQMYVKYGCTGVRGEAEAGYPTVLQTALPLYRALRDSHMPINDVLVETLLRLIAETLDTNIASRHDLETAIYAQQAAKRVIDLGGVHTEAGKQGIKELDQDFINRYISPGGCADLLAVTHFLHTAERSLWTQDV